MRTTGLALVLLLAGSASAAGIDAKDDGNNPRYDPFELTAEPGEQVTLHDVGAEPHTLTSVDGAWAPISVEPGASLSIQAPVTAGDYRFYCAYHASPQTPAGQGMAGVLHVVEGTGAPPGGTPGAPTGGGGPAPTGGAAPAKPTPDLGLLGPAAALALGLLVRRKA